MRQNILHKTALTIGVVLALATPGFAADPLATYFDGELNGAERDVLGLAKAMPADKYDFSPASAAIKGSQFTGVRTFGEQLKHIAATIYDLSATALGEKPPVDTAGESGPANLKTKDQILKYVTDAFAYGHKAIGTITAANQLQKLKGPYGGEMSRIALASMPTWHTFDHYGQMVVYARMNGVTPGSQPAPPPAKK